MKTLRIGTIILLTGLILLHPISPYDPYRRSAIFNGSAGQNDTLCYNLLVPPVGEGFITAGKYWDSSLPYYPIHISIVDPEGRVLVNKDTMAPSYHRVYFGTRGIYRVNVTNRGTEQRDIPVGVFFEKDPSPEMDKLLSSQFLIALGTVLIITDIFRSRMHKRPIGSSEAVDKKAIPTRKALTYLAKS